MRTMRIEESLKQFVSSSNIKIDHVVDVGVQWGTPFLIEAFPDAKHWLIEPVREYHQKIMERYEGMRFRLMPYAVSDSDGLLLLHEYDLDQKGRVSHSTLRNEKVDSPYLVAVSNVETRKLDNMFVESPFQDFTYIVKIDVDGMEEKIIAGGQSMLRKASLVIVEAPLWALQQRLGLIQQLSFNLWDICDPAYYYDQLHQVDLVFVNSEIKKSNINFRPWDKTNGALDRSKWQWRF
jgi:FkbM family methyltransferase